MVNRFRYWLPIRNKVDVPKEFYISHRFDWPVGVSNLDPAEINSTYDAFRMFFTTEVY